MASYPLESGSGKGPGPGLDRSRVELRLLITMACAPDEHIERCVLPVMQLKRERRTELMDRLDQAEVMVRIVATRGMNVILEER